MPVQLPITTFGMEILRKNAKPVDNIDIDVVELVENMFYTMNNADGIGLAAPQVNSNLQVITIDLSPIEQFKNVKPLTLINPTILESYGEKNYNEGCLSLPTLRGDILRPEKIYISYYDLNMKEKKEEFDSMLSRVIQHEIDHLKGILFVDLMNEEDLKKNKQLIKKIKARKIETDYPIFDPSVNNK